MKSSPLPTFMAGFFLFGLSTFSAEKPKLGAPEPLNYANVVSHFKSAGLRTTEVQKRCTIFFEGEWKNTNIYNYALIIVENSDEDIQVTFYFTDAHEMNWITEFLDAPFFTKAETQNLFSLINGHEPKKIARIGRYRVEFHHWQPKHADILVFSFTPARSSFTPIKSPSRLSFCRGRTTHG